MASIASTLQLARNVVRGIFYSGRTRRFILGAIPINQANTDVAVFGGLPSKYRVTRFQIGDATATPILGSLALYTAAAAGGTNIVAAATLTALTTSTKFVDMTLAATADVQTSSSLYVRNVAANAAPAYVSAMLEIIDFS